ncbi:hypothetical protein SSX86_008407 [Deinandra increscens subsp. villosa]|uniref:RING-type E3 ubiquitin transferase n=1 Tax=Deinandra increscens subsp. villosa TaxID=3103831 RepID=A0AAP0DCI1_9ASTR
MDHLFDLDLSLTMEDHHYNTTSTTTTPEPRPPSREEARNQVFAMKSVIDEASGVCMVCLEGFNSSSKSGKQAPCGHIYHFYCITKWLSVHDSCPLCRSKVSDHRISFSTDYVMPLEENDTFWRKLDCRKPSCVDEGVDIDYDAEFEEMKEDMKSKPKHMQWNIYEKVRSAFNRGNSKTKLKEPEEDDQWHVVPKIYYVESTRRKIYNSSVSGDDTDVDGFALRLLPLPPVDKKKRCLGRRVKMNKFSTSSGDNVLFSSECSVVNGHAHDDGSRLEVGDGHAPSDDVTGMRISASLSVFKKLIARDAEGKMKDRQLRDIEEINRYF